MLDDDNKDSPTTTPTTVDVEAPSFAASNPLSVVREPFWALHRTTLACFVVVPLSILVVKYYVGSR